MQKCISKRIGRLIIFEGMTRKYYILSFLLLWTNLLFAGDVKLTATVSKSQVATGEQFEVTFTANASVDDFTPPDFSGFEVLSGPNQSSRMSWINGTSSASVAFSYILAADRVGEFTIGPASITSNGQQVRSNALKIKVVKGKPVPQNQNNNTGATDDEDAIEEAPSSDISKSLFIRAVVNKTHVYPGEQLTVSYRLYTQVQILDNGLDKLPELNGFWSQDIKNNDPNTQWRTETYKGKTYHVTDIKQTILFPQRTGNLTIDPLEMTFVVRKAKQPRDIMEQFFGAYEDAKYKIKSAPVTIHVKPLPEAGKPKDFSGAVGNFAIAASVDKKELKANEALNYKLKISGSGNLKLLQSPSVNFPADFEKYDPKVTDHITESMNGVSGSREYNYLLIPRHEGDYTIGAVTFSYFNPATKKYVSLSAPSFQVKVNKGPTDQVTAFTPGQQDIKELGKDISYIKTGNPHLFNASKEFYGSGLYGALLAAGPLLFLIAFACKKWHEKNNSDLVKVKSRKANKIAAKHLANARKQLEAGNQKAFYDAIFKGIYGYLSDKLNIPVAGLNKETIVKQLEMRSLDEKVIHRLVDTLDLCEMARFAPVCGISEQEVFKRVKDLINDIEQHA